MTLEEIAAIVGAEVLTNDLDLSADVRCAFSADLMSDVLAYAQPGALLLTGLVNPQVARTADMADLAAILFVAGKQPPTETIELARRLGIPLLWANESMFTVSGRLFQAGLHGCEVRR
ncbi:MAG: DRTGG domain-containing protein [Anaerolineae bacterium]